MTILGNANMERTAKKKIKLYKPKQTGAGGGDFTAVSKLYKAKWTVLMAANVLGLTQQQK